MSLTEFVRGWGARWLSTEAQGPLPHTGSTLPLNQSSVSAPSTCGATDQITGAVCTLPAAGPHRRHRDNSDPLTRIEWVDDEWTAHPGRRWVAPTLRLMGVDQ